MLGRGKIVHVFVSIWLLICCTVESRSATIKLVPELSTNQLSVIVLMGEIASGDASELLSVSLNTGEAVVFLNSDGGDATEGLLIAKTVRRLGYGTAVVGESRCMSACALIWVAAKTKFLSKNALVGFHAVYSAGGVSSEGNALFGAFYGQLGLSDRAIRYLTSAPPNGFNQVTLETAPILDIDVIDWASIESGNRNGDGVQQSSSKSNFVAEKGIAISGFDLPNQAVQTTDVAACHDICANNPQCKAYTYDLRAAVCYPKSGGRVSFRNSLTHSGVQESLERQLLKSSIQLLPGKDIVGNDLAEHSAQHIEECIFRCETNALCAAFTYGKKQKKCWLKSQSKPVVAGKSLMSGIK